MSYGEHALYTQWSQGSLDQWKDLGERSRTQLFIPCGVLVTAPSDSEFLTATRRTLTESGVPFDVLSVSQLRSAYPQMEFSDIASGIFEPGSGALLARRAVQTVVDEAIGLGVEFRTDAVQAPADPFDSLATSEGSITADQYVFACGPWLPKLFPQVVGARIQPSRQEVFFFGTAAGDRRFRAPAMPVWIDFFDGFYSLPDIESRGFKLAVDSHGPPFDPDTEDRQVTPQKLDEVRGFLSRRFPALSNAPLLEARVCQYENTSNGDFLIDRHPTFPNVWLVGGGSGHGFKHGPALGQHVARLVTGEAALEPRFSLAAKEVVRARTVY